MVTFKNLWKHQLTISGVEDPCTTNGKKNIPNQCSIRVGAALAKCGVKTANIPGTNHCWHGHDKSLDHVIRAEELANGLNRYPIAGIDKVIKANPTEFSEKLSGETGIIFFKDYWQRTINEKMEAYECIIMGKHSLANRKFLVALNL